MIGDCITIKYSLNERKATNILLIVSSSLSAVLRIFCGSYQRLERYLATFYVRRTSSVDIFPAFTGEYWHLVSLRLRTRYIVLYIS